MSDLLTVALDYIRRSWSPVPIPFMTKGPTLQGWQHLRVTAETVGQYFNGVEQNIGVLLGVTPSSLADADLDSNEALLAAPHFLKRTAVFGRKSAPASHWIYQAAGFSFSGATRAFDDPNRVGKGARLLELRVGGDERGCQTVFPGSTHPCGEKVRWESDSLADPVRVAGADLEARVCRLAAASLVARYWPAEGQRHTAALAVGAALRRGGWPTPGIRLFVSAICAAAGDPELKDRVRAAVNSSEAVDADRHAYGLPTLSALIGREVTDAVVEWLGLTAHTALFAHFGTGGGAASTAAAATPVDVPLDPAALHGLAGDVVRTITPHSEADPLAILLQFLTAFGACCGRSSYATAEADRHPPQIWPVLVGVSSRGRKGSSWGHVQAIFERVQGQGWTTEHFVPGGLSSGEGVIWAVRDPIFGRDKKTGQEVEIDPGVRDKRLLVVEGEFASCLRQFERLGNNLSATLRSLWDRGNVRSLTKNSPAKTTGAHVCVVGHITQDELLRYLDRTEMANGFANRLLLACVKRSKRLPFGGALPAGELDRLSEIVRARLQDVARAGERRVHFTHEAHDLWAASYDTLTEDRPGIYGAITARAEAQVLRLALTYSLLDEAVLAVAALIDVPHLQAALAVWKYCDASAAHIFGRALGDPVADEIQRLLQQAPRGVTRNDIREHFGRHRGSSAVGRALALLLQHGLARYEANQTGGRPEERWYAV